MNNKYIHLIIILLIVLLLGGKLFIYTTQCIYEYIPRTENLNCLVFKLLKSPIEEVGAYLNQYDPISIYDLYTLEYVYMIALSLYLSMMMFLVEIAALLGAIVLLFVYTVIYLAEACIVLSILYFPMYLIYRK